MARVCEVSGQKDDSAMEFTQGREGGVFFSSVVFLSWKMKLYLCQPGFFFFSFFSVVGVVLKKKKATAAVWKLTESKAILDQ